MVEVGDVPVSGPPRIDGIEGLRPIGRGGFATVYRGDQPAFRREVAVKVLHATGFDAEARRRFERECQAMGALSDHPGIVTLYDAGFTTDGRPYLVMPFMPGGSLHDRVRRDGPVPWREVAEMGVRLSGALETAHRAGVLHRDVKPGNVLRSPYGDQLTDFGIARVQGGHETRSGVITASVAHAAPEILDGAAPTPAADVYGLASSLHEAAAGQPAFARRGDESLVPLIRRVLTDPPPDLRERGVPDEVAAVVERGMAKDPADRFPSAEAFGRAMRDAQTRCGVDATTLTIAGSAAAAAAGLVTGSRPGPGDGTGPPGDDATRIQPTVLPAGSSGVPPTVPPAPGDDATRIQPTVPPAPGDDATRVQPAAIVRPGGGSYLGTDAGAGDGSTVRAAVLITVGLALVLVLVVGLFVVLGGDDEAVPDPVATSVPATGAAPATDPPASPTTAAPPTTAASTTAPAVAPIVTPLGVVVPAGAGHPLVAGFEAAATAASVELAVLADDLPVAEQIDGLLATDADPIVVLASVPDGEATVAAVTSAAAASPERRFVVVDGEVEAPNVTSFRFADHEGAYLMGVAAALATADGRVGYLGGEDVERLSPYEAGFVAGARATSPVVQVDVRHGTVADDLAESRDIALGAFADGADVLLQVGAPERSGVEAADAGFDHWVIGTDLDLAAALGDSPLAEEVLTSMVKDYGAVAEIIVERIRAGTLVPGVEPLGLADGMIDWAPLAGPLAGRDDELAAVRDRIVAGEVDVPRTVERRALAPRGADCPTEGCEVRIVEVEPEDGELRVVVEANWFLAVGDDHAHYYWSPTYTAAQVGNDSATRFGVAVGDWDLDDRYPVYVTEGAASLAERSGATELCVTAADADHNVIDPERFDCIAVD